MAELKSFGERGRWFELEVKARLESLSTVGTFIAETLRELDIEHARDVFEIQLAVDEACTNIIKHAYSKVDTGVITVRCGLSDSHEDFVVKIRDDGRPFDPRSVPSPNTKTELNERKEGGLGIFLMKKIMACYYRWDIAQ